jgi:hypothetical protein
VGLDLGGVPLAQPVPHERAEVLDAEPARVRRSGLEVGLQVGLPEALTGPDRERRSRVRGEPEQRRDLGGGLAFDLGVPEDELPAFGELLERPQDQPLVGAVLGLDGQAEVEHLGLVLGGGEPGVGCLVGAPPDGPAHRGEQVGPEGLGRARSAPDGPQDPSEGVGHDVVGLVPGPGQVAGQRRGCRLVAQVELAVGVGVTGADEFEQVRVGRTCRPLFPLDVVLDGRAHLCAHRQRAHTLRAVPSRSLR